MDKRSIIVTNRGLGDITRLEDFTPSRIQYLSGDPRYIHVLFWSWRIPPEIWSRWETVIYHMTDVPYGRGGQPLRNLIIRGHKNTMLSALQCTEEWDAGEVYMKLALDISHGTASEIYNRADRLIREVMIPFIDVCQPLPVPQRGEVTHFRRWQCSKDDILRVLDDG